MDKDKELSKEEVEKMFEECSEKELLSSKYIAVRMAMLVDASIRNLGKYEEETGGTIMNLDKITFPFFLEEELMSVLEGEVDEKASDRLYKKIVGAIREEHVNSFEILSTLAHVGSEYAIFMDHVRREIDEEPLSVPS